MKILNLTNSMALLAILMTCASTASCDLQQNSVKFTSCGRPTDLLTISSIEIGPDPPSASRTKALTILAKGILKQTIHKGATLTATATVGVTKNTMVYDVCEELAKSGVMCPVEPGMRELQTSVELPTDVRIPPFVTVDVKAVGVNADGQQIFCLQGPIKFVP